MVHGAVDDWIRSFHDQHDTGWGKSHFRQSCYDSCEALLCHWPRGDGPGDLLGTPIVDETPVGERGVAVEWLAAVHARMQRQQLGEMVPTRVFVEGFVKPTTMEHKVSLYFFVPPAFRQPPTSFVSHAWDGLMSHWLHALGSLGTAAWLDVFAITQHSGNSTEVAEIGRIVEAISNTQLVMPGCGEPYESMRPIMRSWCIYEIVFSPPGCLHVIVGTNNWKEYRHREQAQSIAEFSVATAEAFDPADKVMIDQLVLDRFQSFDNADELVRGLLYAGFYSHYVQMGDRATDSGTALQREYGKIVPWSEFAGFYLCDAMANGSADGHLSSPEAGPTPPAGMRRVRMERAKSASHLS